MAERMRSSQGSLAAPAAAKFAKT
eukprot:COSAG01_NODE_30334_length_618_cov_0.514451_1_plen_23_part_10